MKISYKTKMRQWERMQTANESERQRVAYLKGPVPVNDPLLFEKIKVRIVKPFYNNGELQTPSMGIILIGRFEAGDLLARGKVEFISEQ